MYVNNARTVSEALAQGLHWLRNAGISQESRVGEVIVAPAPVLTVYSRPLNRVLFSPIRDANPFFHVFESLWMLAGRNDLPWLTQFNSKFSAYSDDGGLTQPGAYGYRWRNYFGYDQLEKLAAELRANPQTRRAVLTMWDGGDERFGPGDSWYREEHERAGDLIAAIAGSADVPCNTHAYFDTIDGRLNMTVCCRSNDALWGAHGANAVHFSFLLEYMAAMTGLPMGVYRQFSNNYHLYTNIVAREHMMPMSRDVEATDRYLTGTLRKNFTDPDLRRVPLTGADPAAFTEQLRKWFDCGVVATGNAFLDTVASPMLAAWQAHKTKDYEAADRAASRIMSEDWRLACSEWLRRRRVKHEQNTSRFTDVVPTVQEVGNGAA